MKASSSSSWVAVFLVVMVVMLLEAQVSVAVTCNPTELSPCASSLGSSAPPSQACCSKLKEQQPCLCGYYKNPNFRQYVNSPNARKVASTCGVSVPNC